MMRVRGVILDYGRVLSHPQRPAALERMADELGATAASLESAYWAHRPRYDLGLHAAEYWSLVARDLRPERPLTPATIAALVELDVWSWTEYREEVWEAAASFREAGGRLAILSNGVAEIMDRVRHERQLDGLFDAVVVSCDVGRAKPDPEVYRLALAPLATSAGDTLFVDDREENLAGARALGLQTLRFDERVPVAELARHL
jgi:putative hydrolase of the HAD superfamily